MEQVSAKVDEAIKSAKPTNLEAIRQFGAIVQNYKELFRKQLGKAVKTRPCDNKVEKIVNAAESHRLFQPSQLERWLDWKEEELEMANVIGGVKGLVAFLKKHQLNSELANSVEKKNALVLNIPQLNQETDKILSSMKDNEDPFTNTSMQIAIGVPWYTDKEKRKLVLDKIRELAEHMENNKHLEGQVKFFITSSESTEDFGCYYSIYEADQLFKDKLDRLPSSPIGLQIQITESSLRVVWDQQDFGYPHTFIVQYRLKESSERTWKNKEMTSSKIRFNPGPQMEVRVAMETLIGRSKFSDVLLLPAAAKKLPPNVKSVTDSTAEIEWIPASAGGKFSYRVQFWSNIPGSSMQKTDVGDATHCLLEQLLPETTYSVKIVIVLEDGQEKSSPSEIIQFTTSKAKKIRFCETMLTSCKKIGNWNDLDIYALPVTKSTQPGDVVDRFVFGAANPDGKKKQKTILLLGAAGSGKTTLINSIANFIFKVEWADPFRFQLVEDKLPDDTHQIHTKTSKIAIYDIHHVDGFNIPFSLTIVDTPGYKVKNYQNNDEEIAQMIRQLIQDQNGIKELDFISYVLNSYPSYSMTKELPIFDAVLSMFGKDVKDNINLILTFADGHVPNEFAGFKNRLSKKNISKKQLDYHSFNNLNIFCSKQCSRSFDFWNMTTQNFAKFFNDLARKRTTLLSKTRQLWEEKIHLEEMEDSLSKLINVGLSKKDAIEESNAVVSECLLQIEAYKKKPVMDSLVNVDLPQGQLAKNCRLCFVTCQISNTGSFASLVTTPFCDVCPGKCELDRHSNNPYRIASVKQEAILKLEADIQKTQTAKDLLSVLQKELEDNEKDIIQLVDIFGDRIERLEDISLCPKPFISEEFIDMIIKNLEQRKGFQEKIEKLRKFRKDSPFVRILKRKKGNKLN